MIFGEQIYNTVVRYEVNMYKSSYEKLSDNHKPGYWKDLADFYHSLTDAEKEIFYRIIQNTLIDTTSAVLGVLDGSCSLSGGGFFETEVTIDGEDMEHEMQDSFLAYVEEEIRDKYGGV